MKRIEKITIKQEIDPDPDIYLEDLGIYSQEPKEGAIDREAKGDTDGSYRYFNPANPEYAEQDYERMEAYNKQQWYMMEIKAEAEVWSSQDGKTWLRNILTSGGICGIESDTEEKELKSIAEDQMKELEITLKEYGFTTEEISKAVAEAETKEI